MDDYSTAMSDRELAELKRRQLLRSTHPELRELESRLRIAYINKARKAQLEEKRLEAAVAKAEKEREADQHRRDLALLADEERKEVDAQRMAALKYQMQLDLQLQQKQAERNKAFREFVAEKKAIDEVLEKVRGEARERAMQTLVKKQVEKSAIEEFQRTQDRFVRLEKERSEREDEAIRRFLQEKEVWLRHQEEVTSSKRQFKHEAILKLAEEIHARDEANLERERIALELEELRLLELDRAKERMEMESELRRKLHFRESNEAVCELRLRQKEKDQREEEDWKRALAARMAEEDKLEQMSAQKRRMKALEHKREIERLVALKQQQKQEEKREEARFWDEMKREEQEIKRIVEEERIRLLRQHAAKLVGFLPAGTLTDADVQHLGVAFADRRKAPADPLAELERIYIRDT